MLVLPLLFFAAYYLQARRLRWPTWPILVGAILLGLEILVAGDLIRTVAVAPTLDNVIVLGLIVLIRTFLSFSLEIEIDGVPPWRKALVSGATVITQAQKSARDVPDAP